MLVTFKSIPIPIHGGLIFISKFFGKCPLSANSGHKHTSFNGQIIETPPSWRGFCYKEIRWNYLK